MTATVSFHRLATKEFVKARRWFARRGAGTEARFVAAMRSAILRVEANPAIGGPSFGNCRWIKVGRFPYLLHYEQVAPRSITIYAVAHAHRKPGYWLGRTRKP